MMVSLLKGFNPRWSHNEGLCQIILSSIM